MTLKKQSAWLKQPGERLLRILAIYDRSPSARSLSSEQSSPSDISTFWSITQAFQRTYGELGDIPEDEFDTTFRTNVYGTFFLTQAALPRMKPGGVILNSCSIELYEPKDQLAPYAATKAALVSLTKSFSKLCMKHGIRVNGVAPGPVWTPLIPSTMPEEEVMNFGKSSLFGRPAQPVEHGSRLYLSRFGRRKLRDRGNLWSNRRKDARLAYIGTLDNSKMPALRAMTSIYF